MCRQFSDVERHNFVPIPELDVRHAVRSGVLLQGRLHQDDVELVIQTLQIERLQIAFQIHRRVSPVGHQVVLELDQFAKFWIFFKSEKLKVG